MIFLLIPVIFIVILILIYTIKVTISFDYKINGLNDTFIIIFSILRGIIKYKYLPKDKATSEKVKEEKKKSQLDGAFEKITNLTKVYKTIRKKLILENLLINIDFGTGDAFYTGVLSGAIWSFVGIIASYMFETFQICEKKINVNSKFSEKIFFVHLNCIFNVKIVYIIQVTIKILFEKFLKKIKIKGGDVSV